MKEPKPYFRAFDGWWYVQLRVQGRRQQIKLVKGQNNEQLAYAEYHKLMASGVSQKTVRFSSDSVAVLLDQFLEHCSINTSPKTYSWYVHFLSSFQRSAADTERTVGQLPIDDLKVCHVTDWLNKQTRWNSTSKNCATRAVRRAFRWLRDEGRISKYPLTGLKAPRRRGRETTISTETFQGILSATRDQEFKDLLSFLMHTGCRPQEVCAVEGRHVDLSLKRIVFPASESKGGEVPRVIYLNDQALGIVQRLCKPTHQGPVFRNRRGRPWKSNAVRCRFRRLRGKFGRLCAYHCRHTFATKALQTLDPITVSVLLGHADPSTLARTYQHLAKDPQFLLNAARKATAGASV